MAPFFDSLCSAFCKNNASIDIIISEIFDTPMNSKYIETFEFDIETKFFKCCLPWDQNEPYYFKRDQKSRPLWTIDNLTNENIYRKTDGVTMGSPVLDGEKMVARLSN